MSSYPSQPGQPATHGYQPPPTNGLGIAGFVVSLSGMIVCMGLICPIGLILSLIALTKQPRGYAIAGSIIGLLGSVLGILTVLVVSGVIGSGFLNPFAYSVTQMNIDAASYEIDDHFMNNSDTLPDEPTGTALISGYLDEWGNALKYVPTTGSTTDYTITSPGEDGVHGTADDMVQYYTAYNWSSTTLTHGFEEEITEDEVASAFNFAAKKIVSSFPVESPMPTEQQVAERAGTLFDAWQMPMKYSPTDNPPMYHLKSAGPDKQWDTGDDLTRSFYFAPTGESDGPL